MLLVVDFFFATRPLVLVPAWSLFLLGHAASPLADAPVPWLRLLHLSMILIATHLTNQVVDFETDRVNNKGFFLQRDIFSRRLYIVVACLLIAAALAHAAYRQEAMWELGLAAALGLAYNLSPLRLSRRPIVDMLANALGYGCVAFLLAQPNATWNRQLLLQLLAGGLAVSAVFLHTTLLDIRGDEQEGKHSTGVWLGPQRTRRLALACAIGAAVTAAPAAAPHLFAACLALAVLSLLTSSQRISVLGTAAFAATAAIACWWFAVVLLLLLAATRIYYRYRFGLRYPARGAP